MKAIDLNELPARSPWPARLLGLEPWTVPQRDLNKVRCEYDLDKYSACLDYAEANCFEASPDDVKTFELGGDVRAELCISAGPELRLATLAEARAELYELIASRLAPAIERAATVVELGCGYGYNLWMLQQRFPEPRYVGGELSPTAVRLASCLYDRGGPRVERFDFYDESDYGLIRQAAGPVLVFTTHAIEQLPSARPVIEALIGCGEKIDEVVHFEPVVEAHDQSLLGLMRQRYARINDYNRDLVTLIDERAAEIELLEVDPELLGVNPLNPTSVVRWRTR